MKNEIRSKLTNKIINFGLLSSCLIGTGPALAVGSIEDLAKSLEASRAQKVEAPEAEVREVKSVRVARNIESVFDFNDTLIQGKMKAPHGFFIQGRQAQTLVQMVKLRSEFRHRLMQSKYAVRSIVR